MANLESLRWIPAPISIDFSLVRENTAGFAREFECLAESDEDPVGQWLKLARARGETKESDPVMLQLLVELHRKVDSIAAQLQGANGSALGSLQSHCAIDGVNFTHFRLQDPMLAVGERYYARVRVPVFPQRDLPLYFEALSDCVGLLQVLHERDQRSWDGYVATRERLMIRQLKGKNDSE